jgi:hypothetical protein
MNRPYNRAAEIKILEAVTPRAQQLRDDLRFYFRNAAIIGHAGAYRVHYPQKYFRWPCHTSDTFPTLETVAAHIGAASLNGSTGNELKHQKALAVRAARRFPSLLKINRPF